MLKCIAAAAAILMCAALAPAQQSKSGVEKGRKVNSCTLVSRADVESATGQSASEPAPNPQNTEMCDFQVGQGKVRFMHLTVTASETPDISIASLRKNNVDVLEVKGLGRRAFYADHHSGTTQLNAYKGSSLVILTLYIPGASVAKQKAVAEALMPKALAKL